MESGEGERELTFKGNSNQGGSGQNTRGQGEKKRKRKNKGKEKNKEKVSSVTGGDKGEARYCYKCGAEQHIAKDCKKTGPLKCIAHPGATSHENRARWIWRKENNLLVTTTFPIPIKKPPSKDRENKSTPPPGGAGGGHLPLRVQNKT